MSKYKVLKDNIKNVVAQEFEKTIPIITEEYEAKIKRQAAEITRLLAENERLKKENKTLNVKVDYYESYSDKHEEECEQAFNQGTEAAWELARKITCQPINDGFNRSEFEKIFGYGYISDIFEKYKYTEATAKVAEWEKAKEEVKVGDIITHEEYDKDLCVMRISPDKKTL